LLSLIVVVDSSIPKDRPPVYFTRQLRDVYDLVSSAILELLRLRLGQLDAERMDYVSWILGSVVGWHVLHAGATEPNARNEMLVE
jgi:hypothetical protein